MPLGRFTCWSFSPTGKVSNGARNLLKVQMQHGEQRGAEAVQLRCAAFLLALLTRWAG